MPKKTGTPAAPRLHRGEARGRILAAAEAAFAEKGYDGTRIDEIADRAGVNKAHLYYHFDGKEALLCAVIEKAVAEIAAIIRRSFANMESFDFQAFQTMNHEALGFFNQRSGILRILIREAMKSSSEDFSLFAVFDPVYRQVLSSVQGLGVTRKGDPLDSLVGYFFFDLGPILLYAALGDKFARFYEIEAAELERAFRRLYVQSLRRYAERIAENLAGQDTGGQTPAEAKGSRRP